VRKGADEFVCAPKGAVDFLGATKDSLFQPVEVDPLSRTTNLAS
jgi:hypothetical protein